MRSHFLLVAALAAASASQPASAGEAGAVLTNQELQRLIPGNESTAASRLGGTYTDAFLPDGSLSRTNFATHGTEDNPMHAMYLRNSGTWSIDENKLCRQISVVSDGRKYCVSLVRDERGFQMIYPSGFVEAVTFKNP
ncbi:MAG TPA: hypothetical protein VGJ20_05160 [Xanthobacteraceae bacterium]